MLRLAFVLAAVCGCAASSSTVVTATSPRADTVVVRTRSPVAWPMRVREHVDLWLHAFAILHPDSSLVPYFRPGYRESVLAARAAANVATDLDVNARRLEALMRANPALMNAQFVALYFDDWEALRQAADAFIIVEGDTRRVASRALAQEVAALAAYFPTGADREFLRLLVRALVDEQKRFYSAYWRAEQQRRGATFDQANGRWTSYWMPRFQPFLANTGRRNGEVLASIVLGGEGRTIGDGRRPPTVAVTFPSGVDAIDEVAYVFAHEVVGPTAAVVVDDHTTPAEKRAGDTDRLASLATVRGGAMLLARIAPEAVSSYQAYYLRLAGLTVPGRQLAATFAATYPIPEDLRDALARQIDNILGGI